MPQLRWQFIQPFHKYWFKKFHLLSIALGCDDTKTNKTDTKPALRWGYSQVRKTGKPAKTIKGTDGSTWGKAPKLVYEQKLGKCSRASCQWQRMALAYQMSGKENRKRQSQVKAQLNVPEGSGRSSTTQGSPAWGLTNKRTVPGHLARQTFWKLPLNIQSSCYGLQVLCRNEWSNLLQST